MKMNVSNLHFPNTAMGTFLTTPPTTVPQLDFYFSFAVDVSAYLHLWTINPKLTVEIVINYCLSRLVQIRV
jgi:hypothetical protein